MKNNYVALAGLALLFVLLIAASGSYLYAIPADILFLSAYVSYRRQKGMMGGANA